MTITAKEIRMSAAEIIPNGPQKILNRYVITELAYAAGSKPYVEVGNAEICAWAVGINKCKKY